jgi:hypothetical protein
MGRTCVGECRKEVWRFGENFGTKGRDGQRNSLANGLQAVKGLKKRLFVDQGLEEVPLSRD